MNNTNLSLTDIGKMMREVFRVFKKRAEEQIKDDCKISIEQYGLLHAISIMEEDVIQKDMAEMMGKDKSAILRLIDSLEEKELVRRVVDLKDRRKNYLMVTKLGERILEQYIKISDDLMKEIKNDIPSSEIETFQKVAKQLKINAEKL